MFVCLFGWLICLVVWSLHCLPVQFVVLNLLVSNVCCFISCVCFFVCYICLVDCLLHYIVFSLRWSICGQVMFGCFLLEMFGLFLVFQFRIWQSQKISQKTLLNLLVSNDWSFITFSFIVTFQVEHPIQRGTIREGCKVWAELIWLLQLE